MSHFFQWKCICGYWGDCGEPRLYYLTQHQARAVARKLNGLETENKGLSAMLAASTLCAARFGRQRDDARAESERLRAEVMHWKAAAQESTQGAANIAGIVDDLYRKEPCGHERRFVVNGLTNFMGEDGITKWGMRWCALCGLESLRAHLREHHAAERWAEEVTDEVP